MRPNDEQVLADVTALVKRAAFIMRDDPSAARLTDLWAEVERCIRRALDKHAGGGS